MKIAQINMLPNGSTGKIMLQIAKTARSFGHETASFTTDIYTINGKKPHISAPDLYYYGSFYENAIHNYAGKLLGLNGYFSYFGTKRLIRMLRSFSPDVVHLHNLHAHCINLPLLFRYLRTAKVRVVWTLHDCWSFTGHCPHFDMAGCNKWQTGCYNCSQLKSYPKSYLDTTKFIYKQKKKMFTAVENLTLVTPSQWLAALVKQSFLKAFPVRVINNGIDLSIFKPTQSNLRSNFGLNGKNILLGVAFGWSTSKGLDVFIELSKRLDRTYTIVLVGTDERAEAILPNNIISVRQTQSQEELAAYYTMADLFVNPTCTDTFPTVNIECLACGTPVLTFNTGGSPEIINETCGCVVAKNDIDALEKEIIRICTDAPFTKESCLMRARTFDKFEKYKEYVKLYENCTHST